MGWMKRSSAVEYFARISNDSGRVAVDVETGTDGRG